MDGRLKRLLAAATTVVAVGAVGAVGVVGVVGVAGADDHAADQTRPMHDETSMHEEVQGRHAHMGAGHHRRDIDELHTEMSRQLPPEDRALHARMHESCAGHTDERIDT